MIIEIQYLLVSSEVAAAVAVDTVVVAAAEDVSAVAVVVLIDHPRLAIRATPPSTSQLA